GLLRRASWAARRLDRDDRLRLALAHAWITAPRLLLLDEPLRGAGSEVAAELLASLDEWLDADPRCSLVVAGQSLRPFAGLLTRAFLLQERALVAVAPQDLL
ncbi:MAG: hypothetical protein ACE5G2_08190, partial [Candidatus Krumholzibacteriia bacterium]